MQVAAVVAVKRGLLPSLNVLRASLATRKAEFDDIVNMGRTHLVDATPLTLGHLSELALAGTAVRTGLNAPPQFGPLVAAELSKLTGCEFVTAPNKFEALATHDAMVYGHGALKGLAAGLHKIASDIRLMASGPRGGL